MAQPLLGSALPAGSAASHRRRRCSRDIFPLFLIYIYIYIIFIIIKKKKIKHRKKRGGGGLKTRNRTILEGDADGGRKQ